MSSARAIFTRIILLSIGACEARLGLALIVLMSRTYGSDKIQSVTANKC
jgi:NADH-ubiquinone oxidoreductase chain 4L